MGKLLIQGVELKDLKVIPDERGKLMEILRSDEKLFKKFGQVYMTTAYPGVVKAWHCHEFQTDYMAVIKGMMKIVLYDSRPKSKTFQLINELFIGEDNPKLIKIPKMVYHGFKCISLEEAIVINVPTKPYKYEKPDELRIDPHNGFISYDWARMDG